MVIVSVDDFDLEKISFSMPDQDKNAAVKTMFVKHAGGTISIKTPMMSTDFGISQYQENTPFTMDLSFYGADKDDERGRQIRELRNKLEKLDDLIMEEIAENSKDLLGKKYEKNKLIEMEKYRPIVKYSRDEDGNVLPYPPTMKLKIYEKRDADGNGMGAFTSGNGRPLLMVDSDDNVTELTNENGPKLISKRSRVVVLMELVKVSISKQTGVSVQWKLCQVRKFTSKQNTYDEIMIPNETGMEKDMEHLHLSKEISEEEPLEQEFVEEEHIEDVEPTVTEEPKRKTRSKRSA